MPVIDRSCAFKRAGVERISEAHNELTRLLRRLCRFAGIDLSLPANHVDALRPKREPEASNATLAGGARRIRGVRTAAATRPGLPVSAAPIAQGDPATALFAGGRANLQPVSMTIKNVGTRPILGIVILTSSQL
jgi:hypothetical protein